MSGAGEPRALAAALSAPRPFTTRGVGIAMHAADRHVERWAPEIPANQPRPLKNLGFVDRLVSPWLDTSRRGAMSRMFGQYATGALAEREPTAVSWVFPRPWYQDELDWMAAAREASVSGGTAPRMLTTRGTYVPAARAFEQRAMALPSALFEYVAPSLSVARPETRLPAPADAFSPLVPFAASQAARVMTRAVAPVMAQAMTPPAALRAVLTSLLERSGRTGSGVGDVREAAPSRLAMLAPEMVTPPAPRADDEPAARIAEHYAEQRAQLADVQRVSRALAERELGLRMQGAAAAPRAQAAPREAEIQRRAAEVAARREAEAAAVDTATQAERARIEERIAQRLSQRTAQETRAAAVAPQREAREQAARDARSAASTPVEPPRASAPAQERRVPAEIVAAMAALPAEFASFIGRRPERAVEAVGELVEALRAVELMARTASSGGALAPAHGPRLTMPAGLGGLMSTVQTSAPIGAGAASPRATRTPTLPWLAPSAARPLPVVEGPRPRSALAATAAAKPAALGHVAWADRWLARFAGARPDSLGLLAATAAPELRYQALAGNGRSDWGAVFVAPQLDRPEAQVAGGTASAQAGRAAPPQAQQPAGRAVPIGRPTETPVVRYDDNAETPDDVFAQISAAVMRTRTTPAAPATPATSAELPAMPAALRESYADLVAHALPAAPGAGLSAQLASSPFAPALRHMLPLPAAPSFDVRALFGDGIADSYLAGWVGASAEPIEVGGESLREPFAWDPSYVAPTIDLDQLAPEAGQLAQPQPAQAAAGLASLAPLVTLRSALLSWQVEQQAGAAPTASSPLARVLVDAMTQPMLGEASAVGEPAMAADEHLAAYAAPGMIADRAHAWSVAQERSTSDLALDFVPPELVLAARVYGLGPAEAAQAARLALAGPGQLGAMASTVDRTFVQVMEIEAERAAGRRAGAPAATADRDDAAAAEPAGATDRAAPGRPSAFGVERRAPRGATLWPQATIASLGMSAASPDGDQAMSVAALELLAAQSVAELGTYAVLGGDRSLELAEPGEHRSSATAGRPAAARRVGGAAPQPTEKDVLDTALALVPAARRAKFEALFVALGEGAATRSQSPAARAARALALAGRGDDTITPHERAAIAWDVLPTVYATPALDSGERTPAQARARRDDFAPIHVDGRPGLSALSARAGEALGSYVQPTHQATPATTGHSSGAAPQGAVMRAPTAAQELVKPGRSAGRFGGGEVEIPSWFESAARKMLADRSGAADGISLAELTLIAAAPSSHVAASTRATPAAVPAAPPAPDGGDHGQPDKHLDVEKIAHDVYKQILSIMDATRARNGDSFQ